MVSNGNSKAVPHLVDMVRAHFPGMSDPDCKELLWECTCFPFGTRQQIAEQVRRCAEGGARTLEQAVAASNDLGSTAVHP